MEQQLVRKSLLDKNVLLFLYLAIANLCHWSHFSALSDPGIYNFMIEHISQGILWYNSFHACLYWIKMLCYFCTLLLPTSVIDHIFRLCLTQEWIIFMIEHCQACLLRNFMVQQLPRMSLLDKNALFFLYLAIAHLCHWSHFPALSDTGIYIFVDRAY